ncbi:MAG: transglycosylase SLT domain-containing protein [Prevotellaceae bacterium]|jgi:membrane-bound lytic murein transglycosylase D|nr:transglycosylase SLT domain-containing protein [Prevotellaceae bacterium]
MKKIIFVFLFFFSLTVGYAQSHIVKAEGDTIISMETMEADNDEEILDFNINKNLDSLLSIWYLQRALRDTSEIFVDIEEDRQQADLPDTVYIERLKRMPTIIDLPYNDVVRRCIIAYTQKDPEKSEMILGLTHYYLPIIEEILDMYELPLELRAMAIIESALNPRAVSRAKAKGMWQFMYPTALRYNLKINSFVDERLDPVAATHAAAKYLKDLYNIFGDWSLAIAAYNCGDGNVRKAIRRSGGKSDYWDIYPYLPRETRGYVPLFVGAGYLLEYYKEHNLRPKQVSMPAQVDTFIINKMLHFEQVSEVIGIPIDELRDFNPQYLHDIIPGTSAPYVLHIPFEYTGLFAEKEKEIYAYKDSVYFNPNIIKQIAQRGTATIAGERTIHRVRKGETLSSIALKYGVKISDLQYWNDIGKSTRINAGQKLVVNAKAKKATAAVAAAKPARTITEGEALVHTVKKGETLWSISQLYDDITFYDIMQINGLTKNAKIYPGNKIVIKKL